MPALYYSTPTISRIAARLEQLERENAELKRNALGPNPTVAEIVRDYLKRNGYDGLFYDGMGDKEVADVFLYADVWNAGYIQPDGSVGPEKEGVRNG
jgi:hypothetical protein